MLTCGACGSSLEAVTRKHGRKRVPFYGCAGHARKGKHVCPNALVVPLSVTDEAVLQAVERGILNPNVVLEATRRAFEALSVDATADHRLKLERGLKDTETELARLSQAIAAGGPLDTLLAAVRAREA